METLNTRNDPAPSLRLWDDAWRERECDRLFALLRDETDWRQEHLQMFGKRIALPRLTAWHGDPGSGYRYSGIENTPLPWTNTLSAIRQDVEALTGCRFNSVLLNFYRSGRDHVSWHADNEPEIDQAQGIVSVSFGASRRFQFRKRHDPKTRFEMWLAGGSVLHMMPPTQENWQHRVPGERDAGPRINLTFRYVAQ